MSAFKNVNDLLVDSFLFSVDIHIHILVSGYFVKFEVLGRSHFILLTVASYNFS